MNYSVRKNAFDQLYRITNGKKMIAMTENGPIPDPGESIRLEAPWSFFMSWSDLVEKHNTVEHIKTVYSHPNVITLENVADFTGLPTLQKIQYRIFKNDQTIQITGGHWSKIILTDVYGRMLLSSNNQDGIIHTGFLQKGVYLVNIYQNYNIVFVQKIII